MTTETIMSIEQKAKAYDEALKRAEAAIDIAADKDLVKGVATTIFPELRESDDEDEDERIRKAILSFIKRCPDTRKLTTKEYSKWVEYLEKQKKQKPRIINQDEKEFLANEITSFLRNYDKESDGEDPATSDVAEYFYLLGKQAQKPAEWSEEDEEMFNEALTGILLAKNRMKDTGCIGLAERFEKAYKWLESLHFQPHLKLNEMQILCKEICRGIEHSLATEFINYLDNNKPEGKMCLSNGEHEDIDKAFKENDWAKIIRYAKKYLIQSEQKPETKLTGWVARDSEYNPYSGLGLILFNEKPRRYYDCWRGVIDSQLPWESFPDLKWEDEPVEVEVEVTIRRK